MGSSPQDGKGFFSQSTSSADSHTVSAQPPCATAGVNICTYVKYPKYWQSYHCLDARKYCAHRQEWVALVMWLLCPTQVRWPKLPMKYNEVLKNKFEKKIQANVTITHLLKWQKSHFLDVSFKRLLKLERRKKMAVCGSCSQYINHK